LEAVEIVADAFEEGDQIDSPGAAFATRSTLLQRCQQSGER